MTDERRDYALDARAFEVQRGALTVRATLEAQAKTALVNNRDFLAIAAPTQAQVLAQVKALSRQNNGVIRLLLNDLSGTD